MEKVYLVEFMNYTNATQNVVCDEKTGAYLEVGKEPFLVKESKLEKYRDYGNGFRSIKFVGNIINS